MESRIPVPTDNIYKFYGLFGLLLFIFSCGALLYVVRTNNELVFAAAPELAGLKTIAQPSALETTKILVLETKLEITKTDKIFPVRTIGAFAGIALCLMSVGFVKWHAEVQPLLDRMTKAQVETAELQLEKLRREVEALRTADRVNPTDKS
jgi:hypothetical protein